MSRFRENYCFGFGSCSEDQCKKFTNTCNTNLAACNTNVTSLKTASDTWNKKYTQCNTDLTTYRFRSDMYSKDYKQCINDKESQINALKLSQEAQRIQYTEEITRLRDSKKAILNNLLTIYRTYIYQIMIKVKDINSVVSSTSPDAELRKYINTLYEQITEIEAQIKDLYSNSLFINSS